MKRAFEERAADLHGIVLHDMDDNIMYIQDTLYALTQCNPPKLHVADDYLNRVLRSLIRQRDAGRN